MRKLREDAETARKVDVALVMLKMRSTDEAMKYLRAATVGGTVVERLLSGEQMRTSMTAAAVSLPEPGGVQDPFIRRAVYCATGRRRDVARAAVVQAALAIVDQFDAARAERLLHREDLPDEVITRVLAGDVSRRRMP